MDSDRGDMNQNHLCRQSPPNNQNLAEKNSTFRIERVSLDVLVLLVIEATQWGLSSGT